MATSTWGPDCNPERVASEFFASTMRRGRSIGKHAYLSAVTAAASAAVTRAMAASTVVDQDVLTKLDNILATFKHVEKLANQVRSGRGAEDQEGEGERDSDDSDSDEDEEEEGKDDDDNDDADSETEEQEEEGERPRKRRAQEPSLLVKLEQVVARLRQLHVQQGDGSGPSTSTAPAGGSAAAPTPTPTTTSTATPASSPGLPLPPAVLPAIFSALDARSAAAAAASCKELRAAYQDHSYHLIPELMALFIQASRSLAKPDHMSDGAGEALYAVLWPLDGSTACGADVVNAEGMRRAALLARQVAFLFPEGTNIVVPPRPTRPAPSPHSSPLASFKESAAIPMTSQPILAPIHHASSIHTPLPAPTASATISSTPAPAPDTAGPSASTSTTTSPAPAPAPPCSYDTLTHACCDVRVMGGVQVGYSLHVDGDMLAVAYAAGYRRRDPGLQGCGLSSRAGEGGALTCIEECDTGLYGYVQEVCADTAYGLVWAAADDGRRIKAYTAPVPRPRGQRFVRQEEEDEPMALRHTLSTDVKGLVGQHTGLHVMGDSLLAVNACGVLMRWRVSQLQPQAEWRVPKHFPGEEKPEEEEEGQGQDEEPEFKHHLGFRYTTNRAKLEATPGEQPHAVHLLQLPVYDMSKRERKKYIKKAAVIADPASPAAPVLVAALEDEQYGNTVLTYDMETLRVRQRLYGHPYDVTGIAVPPPSWQGAPLFATASKTGDVKVWDLRSRCCSPCITLAGREIVEAAVLVAAQGDAGQLGAGLMCFAGGCGEAVWAWDLRAGRAQTLYELSTGNTHVIALAWHQGSSSLLASCESLYSYRREEDRAGGSDDEEEEEEDEEAAGEEGGKRWWPKQATHGRKDFKAYWNQPRSCVMQYCFSGEAKQEVPYSGGSSLELW